MKKIVFLFTGQGARDKVLMHTISVDLKHTRETKTELELAAGCFESYELIFTVFYSIFTLM